MARARKKPAEQLAEAKEKLDKMLPSTIPMDEVDSLRLENILLRETLMEHDRREARNGFQSRIVAKYNIDESKYTVMVDAKTKMISLTPK